MRASRMLDIFPPAIGQIVTRFFWPISGALLTIMAVCQISSVMQESQTWDEAIHLLAGYAPLKTGQHRLHTGHPPLGNLLNAIPLLSLNPKLPGEPSKWGPMDFVSLGRQFLYNNVVPASTMLFRARLVTILLTLVFGLSIAQSAKTMFGSGTGIIALILFVFNPTIIAHGRYVTTDLIVALFIFLTCMSWYRYLLTDGTLDLLLTGVLAGLALCSKLSALALVLILPAIYSLNWWISGPGNISRGESGVLRSKAVKAMAVVAAVAAAIVFLIYIPDPLQPAYADPDTLRGGRISAIVTNYHVPLPRYITVMQFQRYHNLLGASSYFFGTVREGEYGTFSQPHSPLKNHWHFSRS